MCDVIDTDTDFSSFSR